MPRLWGEVRRATQDEGGERVVKGVYGVGDDGVVEFVCRLKPEQRAETFVRSAGRSCLFFFLKYSPSPLLFLLSPLLLPHVLPPNSLQTLQGALSPLHFSRPPRASASLSVSVCYPLSLCLSVFLCFTLPRMSTLRTDGTFRSLTSAL